MHDDIKKYRSIISEIDITRRGFLKGIASIAASTALPTGVVASAVENISLAELSMLEKLLKLGDIYELQHLVKSFSSGIATDAFTDEDWDMINNALPPGTDFWEWEEEVYNNGLDVVSAVEKLIGRKTLISLAGDLAEEYDIDLEDLMHIEEVLDVLGFDVFGDSVGLHTSPLVRSAGEEAKSGEEAAAGEEAIAGLEAGAGEEATVGIANTARIGAIARQLKNKLRKSDDDYDDYDDDDDDDDDYDDDDKTTSNIDEMRKYRSIIAEAYKRKI